MAEQSKRIFGIDLGTTYSSIAYVDEYGKAVIIPNAENERVIMNNLKEIFKGKTAIVVAHRLSTVKDADQIIVLEKGEVVEKGTHEELTKAKGHYFRLVQNQLELGT